MACTHILDVLHDAAMDDDVEGVVVVTLAGDDRVGLRFAHLTPPMMVAAGQAVFLEMNSTMFIENVDDLAEVLSAEDIKKAMGLISSIVEFGRQLSEVLLGEPVSEPEKIGQKETLN